MVVAFVRSDDFRLSHPVLLTYRLRVSESFDLDFNVPLLGELDAIVQEVHQELGELVAV